jgi:flagellar biosynthetic protein FliR
MPDVLAPGVPQAAVLLALRVGGLLLIAPVFSARTVSGQLRTALLLVLTLLLLPVAVGSARTAGTLPMLAVTPAGFLVETLVGLAIGLGAAVLVGAAETAGDLMTTVIGLSGASLFDPLNGVQSTVLAQMAQLFAVTVLLAVDGHLVMLAALGESVRAVPLGAHGDVAAALAAMVRGGATLFGLGVQFAAPVLAAALIGQVALAVLTRAAPQLNVLSVAFPIQIALGMAATVAAFAALATWLTGFGGHLDGQLAPVMDALRARPA